MTARRVAALALRLGLGALLLIAGALKLQDLAGFATEIANYQLLPRLAPYLGAVLPAVEVVIGLGLIALPIGWRRGAAAAALALLAMFTVAVTSAYLRHINIACGCFGAGGDAISWLTLARNLALLAGTAALLALDRADAAEVRPSA
jgi:uncharacterized membrane protein YphA (DoxX/SURF4 family)